MLVSFPRSETFPHFPVITSSMFMPLISDGHKKSYVLHPLQPGVAYIYPLKIENLKVF